MFYVRAAAPMKDRLLEPLEDSGLDVRVVAAEAPGYIGETEKNVSVLVAIIKTGNTHESLAAITALEAFGRSGIMPMEKVKALILRMVHGGSGCVLAPSSTRFQAEVLSISSV
ncbi:MAG: hypothetical protein VCA37_14610 [Roseibacillus sp.]